MKMKIIATGTFVVAGLVMLIIVSGFKPFFQKKPWVVPDNYKSMKNTVASNPQSIAEGKESYATYCKSCHGAKGLGDGSKAAQLNTEPGDFSTADFQSQTDGAIFYKTSEGRGDMPSFKKKIPDADERWSIINYLRTLKK